MDTGTSRGADQNFSKEYVDAGSQIIYAPTFAANRISLKEHGLEDEMISMISRLVSLSKSCAKERCYVAGDLTTTGKTDIPYEELYNVYQEQISCLADAGADLLVAETMMTLDETMGRCGSSTCSLRFTYSLFINN